MNHKTIMQRTPAPFNVREHASLECFMDTAPEQEWLKLRDGLLAVATAPAKMSGICYNLDAQTDYNNALHDMFVRLSTYWPEFSGDEWYPVSCEDTTPHHAYVRASHTSHLMWDEGAYADARWRLLVWVINVINDYLKLPLMTYEEIACAG